MSEASGPHQNRYQERRESGSRLDVIRRFPADRHVLPNHFHKADLAQKRNENRDPAELGRGALRVAQYRSLIRQQSAISLGSGLSAALDCIGLLLDSKLRSNFGFQVSQSFDQGGSTSPQRWAGRQSQHSGLRGQVKSVRSNFA